MPSTKNVGKPGHRYSGPLSKNFWDRINALPEREQRLAYALGCMLQDVEHRLLWFIEEAEKPARKPKAAR